MEFLDFCTFACKTIKIANADANSQTPRLIDLQALATSIMPMLLKSVNVLGTNQLWWELHYLTKAVSNAGAHKFWFHLYRIILSPSTQDASSLQETATLLEQFAQTASIGEFKRRLEMIAIFRWELKITILKPLKASKLRGPPYITTTEVISHCSYYRLQKLSKRLQSVPGTLVSNCTCSSKCNTLWIISHRPYSLIYVQCSSVRSRLNVIRPLHITASIFSCQFQISNY